MTFKVNGKKFQILWLRGGGQKVQLVQGESWDDGLQPKIYADSLSPHLTNSEKLSKNLKKNYLKVWMRIIQLFL